jgi:hypothetical protein
MICKYGNLHVDIYSEETKNIIDKSYENIEFVNIDLKCQFLGNGFKGRKIKI